MAWRRKQADGVPDEVLFDGATVDAVSIPADGSAVELHIVADAPWTGSDAQITSLQQKIHTYVGFAADGQLAAAHPEAAGLPWRIVVQCRAGKPDERTADVLGRTRQQVQQYDGDLIVAP